MDGDVPKMDIEMNIQHPFPLISHIQDLIPRFEFACIPAHFYLVCLSLTPVLSYGRSHKQHTSCHSHGCPTQLVACSWDIKLYPINSTVKSIIVLIFVLTVFTIKRVAMGWWCVIRVVISRSCWSSRRCWVRRIGTIPLNFLDSF